MCSADSVRAEKTKVTENTCRGWSEIFLSNRNSFLWILDLIRFCVEAYKAKPFRQAVVPSRDLHVSVVGCVKCRLFDYSLRVVLVRDAVRAYTHSGRRTFRSRAARNQALAQLLFFVRPSKWLLQFTCLCICIHSRPLLWY